MENSKNRYREMEKYMSIILITLATIFVIYLIAAGTGLIWLKALTAIIDILIGLLCLAYLYSTKLIFAPRSLWMTFAAASIVICILFSLILNFPSVL